MAKSNDSLLAQQVLDSSDINMRDIWNETQWFAKNQQGVASGEIRFCEMDWTPITVKVGHPLVTHCHGEDLLWLSYHINLQKFNRDREMQMLNGHFAVVTTHGDVCDNPPPKITDAPQADCHNWDEYTVIKGEKCVRRDEVINSFGTNHQCFIIYCTNHHSDCELWVKAYWRKCMFLSDMGS